MWGLQMLFADAVLSKDETLICRVDVARREVNWGETTAMCCAVPDKMKTMGAILHVACFFK